MKAKRKNCRRVPRVVAIVSMKSNFGPSVLRGIFAHVAAHGEWGLDIVRSTDGFTVESVRQAVAHKTTGFIIALNDDAPGVFAEIVASGIPFATVETYSSTLAARASNVTRIWIDNSSIGRDAARSFISQGRYVSYGYVSTATANEWSRLRGEGFAREISRRGQSAQTFFSDTGNDAVARRGDLAKWLRRLQKPAAVLAADDSVALETLQACARARIAVPKEVAVLGIDDEELVCENTSPRLSSARPDFVLAGRKAADALERMMRGSAATCPSREIFVRGDSEIVHRESTSRELQQGPIVQKALAYIAANAKNGIGPRDVQNHLKVSRSLMDLRFREARGESVLSVIHAARFAELKRLLHDTDDPIESITRRLGWTSANYPKNRFKKLFGVSMSDWRIQSRRI